MGDERELGSPPTISQIFRDTFPYYLSIGMSYEQFWHGDVCLVKYYRKAHEIEQARKNQEQWLQGMYIYEALCAVSPVLHAFAKGGTKPAPYASRPYAMSRAEARARELEKMHEAAEGFRALAEAKNIENHRKQEAGNGNYN